MAQRYFIMYCRKKEYVAGLREKSENWAYKLNITRRMLYKWIMYIKFYHAMRRLMVNFLTY